MLVMHARETAHWTTPHPFEPLEALLDGTKSLSKTAPKRKTPNFTKTASDQRSLRLGKTMMRKRYMPKEKIMKKKKKK